MLQLPILKVLIDVPRSIFSHSGLDLLRIRRLLSHMPRISKMNQGP